MEEIFFTKKNGMKIAGKLFLPETAEEKYPVVIFSHGFNSQYRYLEKHAAMMAKQGIACLVYDFCGGGMESLSDGDMLSMTVLTEAEDLLTAVEGIQKHTRIDANNLFLMGESQGGYVSALAASTIPEQVKGLILWYPAFVIDDDSRRRMETGRETYDLFGMTISKKFNEDAIATDIYAQLPKYKRDVLILHGDKDEIVPISYSERAVSAYDSAKLVVVPGAGHGYEGQDSINACQNAIDFVKEHLK